MNCWTIVLENPRVGSSTLSLGTNQFNKTQVEPVSEILLEVVDDKAGKDAVASLMKTWEDLASLEKAYTAYHAGAPSPNPLPGGEGKNDKLECSPLPMGEGPGGRELEARNEAQRGLRLKFDRFFSQLHDCLKQIDKAVRRYEKAFAEKAKEAGKRQTADHAIK